MISVYAHDPNNTSLYTEHLSWLFFVKLDIGSWEFGLSEKGTWSILMSERVIMGDSLFHHSEA